MRVIIEKSYNGLSAWAAHYIASKINAAPKDRPFVLGLPTGSSPVGVYQELARMNQAGEVSFANVITFNMDEYIGLKEDDPNSYHYFMHDNFFDHLTDMKKENIHILNGLAEDPEAECRAYEEAIRDAGGIDLFMGGVGNDGHIAFNEPFTSFRSRTGVRVLTEDTRIANSRFFDHNMDAVPKKALSIGIGTLMDAKEVLILANGHAKAEAVSHMVEGNIAQKWPCTALQLHEHSILVCDEDACGQLEMDTIRYFVEMERKEK
jgi:glucosamine-6-phosphate deaminase